MPNKSATPDAQIARVAGLQHGMITARQLGGTGLSRASISERVRAGRLHRVHRGVYAVGHAASNREGRWMAAVLACGQGAVLSHASAAALWGFLRPVDGPIEVSIPSQSGRRGRPGIRLHRCLSLASDSKAHLFGSAEQTRLAPPVTARRGIPVTTPQRTIEDLRRSGVPERLVRRAMRQAELAGWRVREGGHRTRSDLEDDFLALCRRHGLPRPEVNMKIGRWEVDFLWRADRLVVETDAWGTHRGSVAFEDDHAREVDLRARGFSVRRYTEAQIRDLPAVVVADLRAALLPA
jgi:very-short-patch-repair endonuclease